MNVAIACGGTGGHLFPGLAVAEVLRDRGHDVLLFISEKQIDTLAVRDRTDFKIEKIPAVGLPRLFSTEIIAFCSKFLNGLFACRRVFKSFHPHAVIGMGGFTSTAPILAARWSKIPTMIHESNAIPGKANRINARFSDRVALGFAECAPYFPQKPVVVTGTPIRKSVKTEIKKAEARLRLKLNPDLQTVAVIGGSQGAHGINETIVAALPHFAMKPVQFIHLTGREDHQYIYDRYKKEGVPAFIAAFHHRMEEVYSAADVVVARSGAASLSEMAYFGCVAILIPYPFAADDHQTLNAKIFEQASAAELIDSASANGETVGNLIDDLLASPERRERLSNNMRALATKDAAIEICKLVEGSNNGAK
jgi:UDP-N-acetylglucosamine--N-acetylmuramyl-(pentapeptide) pyrophosphoryl-undecaprenol N-acetylglucosamine transferase